MFKQLQWKNDKNGILSFTRQCNNICKVWWKHVKSFIVICLLNPAVEKFRKSVNVRRSYVRMQSGMRSIWRSVLDKFGTCLIHTHCARITFIRRHLPPYNEITKRILSFTSSCLNCDNQLVTLLPHMQFSMVA